MHELRQSDPLHVVPGGHELALHIGWLAATHASPLVVLRQK
jgi:hypothetical protein